MSERSDTPRTDAVLNYDTERTLVAQLCRQLERELAECRKGAKRMNYWAENAAGEFLYDATNHDFIEFIPKKAPRPAELVKSAIDAAIDKEPK